MTIKRSIAVHIIIEPQSGDYIKLGPYVLDIKKGSSLFDFVSEVESKTTLSSKEILEFLINWAYEDYFYNDVDRLLELIDKKRIKS